MVLSGGFHFPLRSNVVGIGLIDIQRCSGENDSRPLFRTGRQCSCFMLFCSCLPYPKFGVVFCFLTGAELRRYVWRLVARRRVLRWFYIWGFIIFRGQMLGVGLMDMRSCCFGDNAFFAFVSTAHLFVVVGFLLDFWAELYGRCFLLPRLLCIFSGSSWGGLLRCASGFCGPRIGPLFDAVGGCLLVRGQIFL